MRVVRTRSELSAALADERWDGARVALIPTMGYLHEGHLSLVDRALESADTVVMSIFVNPTQFAPGEDFDRYPRDPKRDRALARNRGVDLLFVPNAEEMYPGGEAGVMVDPGPGGKRLCGAHRPGHFAGVLTVVAKLLGLVSPDMAVFGRKDYQQLVLIRRMVRELEMGLAVEGAPVVREKDGLALSSRNALLSPDERRAALDLPRALEAGAAAFRSGEQVGAELLRIARERASQGALRIQYLELVDPDTLDPVEGEVPEGTILAGAAFAGTIRLIDNVELLPEVPPVEGAGSPSASPGIATGGEASRRVREGEELHPVVQAAARGRLPGWAEVEDERWAHVQRVAALMGEWARERGEGERGWLRWLAAAHLHDSLRDAEPRRLRELVPERFRDLPGPLLHGPAAAALLRRDGVRDPHLLRAVAFHTFGHPGLDGMGRALYVADFLEPGRPWLIEERALLRDRMPEELHGVVEEVASLRIRKAIQEGRTVRPETAAFWNALRDGARGS